MMSQNVQEIRKQAVFNAPIKKVWKAVATAEGIESWFMPNDFQPVEGHEFVIESQYETSRCKVLKVDEPHEVSFTWGEQGWVVTFTLKEVDGKTEFTLVHSGWGDPDELMRPTTRTQQDVRDTMNGGWEKLVDRALRKAVEN
ncbi:SRPBCC domain-containing protein [Halobacillus salinarum]|uniref:SRPBCC domain-containing protein n=1 Tax=Halobacillus salinarum TaxID=2932257 RepID=A0ABY4EW37_9BACI|nr:SRPBCC domain-containing protein [Halobacillus salinarum]UOQ46376.1 SRPBCC domain-containing protein [Halobacillus salinarum]